MKRSLVIAMAVLCMAAGLWAQGQSPSPRNTAGMNDLVISIGLPVGRDQGNWVVLFSEPAKDLPVKVPSDGKPDWNIKPIADIRAFREDGLAASDTNAQSLQLTVWNPAKWSEFKTPSDQWHLYIYWTVPKSNDPAKWIRLDDAKAKGFLQAGSLKWGANEEYLQVIIREWPTGDPAIGLGDGDF